MKKIILPTNPFIVLGLSVIVFFSIFNSGCLERSVRPLESGSSRERESEERTRQAQDNMETVRDHLDIEEEVLSDRELGERLHGTVIYLDEENQQQLTLDDMVALVSAKIERGYELEKYIDHNEPMERLNLSGPTEKAVNIMSVLDFAGSVAGLPVIKNLPVGMTTTLGWGAKVGARALEVTGMLKEDAYKDLFRSYIRDRQMNQNRIECGDEAVKYATRALVSPLTISDQLDQQYQSGSGFCDLFYVSKARSAGVRNLIQDVGEFSAEGAKNLMQVFEFDYQCYRLATDDSYRQEVRRVLLED